MGGLSQGDVLQIKELEDGLASAQHSSGQLQSQLTSASSSAESQAAELTAAQSQATQLKAEVESLQSELAEAQRERQTGREVREAQAAEAGSKQEQWTLQVQRGCPSLHRKLATVLCFTWPRF